VSASFRLSRGHCYLGLVPYVERVVTVCNVVDRVPRFEFVQRRDAFEDQAFRRPPEAEAFGAFCKRVRLSIASPSCSGS
jgi:hypothetical protein